MKYFSLGVVLLGLILTFALNFCSMETKPLQTVDEVNLERYMGKWYDIAHFPAAFLNGCKNITADYSLTEKNYVKVLNRCIKEKNNKEKSINGKAFIVKGSNNTKLKVQFFWPFRADYWILDIDEDYQYAAIGGPSRQYAWILSRTPDPEEKKIQELMKLLENKGFDTENLERTKHDIP